MYLDSNLKFEALSSLLGEIVKPYDKKTCEVQADILSVGEFLLHSLIGKQLTTYLKELFINEEDFFDPQYDYDFTNLSDSAECKRGDELYERPKGWYRMALKVKGKYPDGDTWLGTNGWRSNSVPGEWPVSYHGTSLDGAEGIIRSHYSAGDRAVYGRGIYSTPDIHVAEKEEYAKTFTSETTGKKYKVILQNRINPEKREICQRDDYWLIPVREGASAKEERNIVESSIRPYGILIKELKEDDEGDEDGDGNDDGNDDDNDSKDGSKSDDGSVSDNCNGDGNGYGDRDGDNDESDDGPDVDDSEDDDIISGDYDGDNDGKHDDGNGVDICHYDDDDDESNDDGNVDDIFHYDDDGDENGSGDGDNNDKESDDDANVNDDDYDDEENNNSTHDDEIVADSCNDDDDDDDDDDEDDGDRGSEDDDAWS